MGAADPPDERRAREAGLLFLGRVVAAQCHELVNVLNIVNELCGLHEDTLPRAREGHAAAVEKLGDLGRRLQAQVARGHAIVRHLSRFAHAADEPWAAFDGRELVERVVAIAARQARLREVELLAALPAAGVPLEGDPFGLQQALHAGIELFLEGARAQRRVTVSLEPAAGGALLTVASGDAAPPRPVAAARLAAIAALVQAAGGELREAPRYGDGDRLVIFVPQEAATPSPTTPSP